jgi:hypothetical protein
MAASSANPACQRTQHASILAADMMTTDWEAPRAGYLLTLAVASGDEDKFWSTVSPGGEADLVIALGAQARLMARTATTATGKPFDVPAAGWESITCPDVRSFAMATYAGEELGEQSLSSTRCLREAAVALASVQLAAMDAAGLPRTWLADVCARMASADESPVTPPPAAGTDDAP